MEAIGKALQERARTLGLSDAEVARRAGLTEQRYSNYITGRRQPDFATLVRISRVLATTPNHLLGVADERPATDERERLCSELLSVARALSDDDLRLVIRQVAAVLEYRRG
ncbi:MAG TPA: helix-turn-helix transcriptional regulator [Azospirillum sp.]